MKRFCLRNVTTVAVFLLLVFVLAVPAFASILSNKTIEATSGAEIYLDGNLFIPRDTVGNTVEVFIYNGTTYLPARPIVEAMNGRINWDAENARVEITTSETTSVPAMPSEQIHTQNDLGGLAPEAALAYMKTTKNLIIVDVAAERWYEQQHFEGALNIPIETLSDEDEKELYLQIPANQPVLLHCRQGVIVPSAYQTLKELRPDIPELSYIAGRPLFEEYNTWYEE